MNKEMQLIFRGSNPKWENVDTKKITQPQNSTIHGVKVSTIPDPEYIPTSLIAYKTIHASIRFEFKYPEKTYETISIENKFGVFQIDKHDKNIVSITFYNKFTAKKWVSKLGIPQSHQAVIKSLVLEKIESL